MSIQTITVEPKPKDLVTLSGDTSTYATGPLPSKPLRHRFHPKKIESPLETKSSANSETSGLANKVLRLRLGNNLLEKEVSPLASAQDDGFKKERRCSASLKNPAAVSRVSRRLTRARRAAQPPRIDTFSDFLTNHALVKTGSGYAPYHFTGREALRPIVERLDQILSSGEADASLAICGGAQFGKTVLMLNLLAYLVAVRFRNVGYYLPDDDLVSGLVDGKLRPDVLDQIPWLARLIAVGKTLNASGRAVNRKGAFLCTDGTRTALAFMRGLGKIPTSFSMDVVVQDEKDDLPEEHARFLAGRMTASNLRLSLLIGTQRYHGAGQNLAFTEGTQHIGLLSCTGCGARHNPETQWPGICRLVISDSPPSAWPRLTPEGHFSFSPRSQVVLGNALVRATSLPDSLTPSYSSHKSYKSHSPLSPKNFPPQEFPIPFSPGQKYVLACPDCGAALDREHPQWHALAPEREAQRRWSYRLSQLLIPAIDLAQIVAAWQLAIRDPEHMTVFCTDRLALPKSTTQALTPGVLEAARGDYPLEIKSEGGPSSLLGPNFVRFGGLDMGDQCWFVARAVDVRAPHLVRLLWVEPIAAERVRSRVPELFEQLGLSALCVDAGPLRDLARDLVFLLNGLDENSIPSSTDPSQNIHFSRRPSGGLDNSLSRWPQATGGHRECAHFSATSCSLREPGQQVVRATREAPLHWHAASEKWRNVRAMAVEFTQREGQGLRHKLARTQEGRLYPLLAANRDETIERVVQELLPPGVGDTRLIELPDGTAATAPTQRYFLPKPTDETRGVLDVYERHLLAGARQERTADGRSLRYIDKCENHFLLATAYAALAELLTPPSTDTHHALPAFRSLPKARSTARRERSVLG